MAASDEFLRPFLCRAAWGILMARDLAHAGKETVAPRVSQGTRREAAGREGEVAVCSHRKETLL